MERDFSKSERKLACQLIDKGIERDFEKILNEANDILSNWKKSLNVRETYASLYKHVKESDKYISRHYDSLRGGDYFHSIIMQFNDGLITEEELKLFSEERVDMIKMIAAGLGE